MDAVPHIRRLGFRRWYERELIKGHAALVTCLLCGITVAALVERLHDADGWGPLGLVAVALGASALGWVSWRSYAASFQRAERYGAQSSCPHCHAYARFRILASGMAWMRVACRRCGTRWRLD